MNDEPKKQKEVKNVKYGSSIVPPGLYEQRRRRKDPNLTRESVVRVRATHEDYRRALKHGISGQRFLPDINQSVEWPNDSFTHRRLKEGSIVLDESPQEAPRRKAEPRELSRGPESQQAKT